MIITKVDLFWEAIRLESFGDTWSSLVPVVANCKLPHSHSPKMALKQKSISSQLGTDDILEHLHPVTELADGQNSYIFHPNNLLEDPAEHRPRWICDGLRQRSWRPIHGRQIAWQLVALLRAFCSFECCCEDEGMGKG